MYIGGSLWSFIRISLRPTDTEGSFMAERAAEIAKGLVDHLQVATRMRNSAVRRISALSCVH